MKSLRPHVPVVLAAALAVLLVGCGPDMPTPEHAKAWYGEHQPALDTFEKTILAEAGKMPWVQTGQRPPCVGSGVTPTGTVALVWERGNPKPVEKPGVDCEKLNLDHIEGQKEASRRFVEQIPTAAEEAGILVGEVSIQNKNGTIWVTGYLDEDFRYHPAFRNGTRVPGQGVLIGTRRVGWGLYQGDWEGYRPGIAVEWGKPFEEHTVSFRVMLAAPTTANP